jgi:hypothetical protein
MLSTSTFTLTLTLIYSLLVWGITSVLTQGRIFRAFRDRFELETLAGDFVRCPQCVGWWVGLLLSLSLRLGVAQELPQLQAQGLFRLLQVVRPFCDAFIACAITAFASKVEDALKGVANLMIRR